MDNTRPVYKHLLIAAIVIYVIATAFMFSSLFTDVERMKHTLMHLTGEH